MGGYTFCGTSQPYFIDYTSGDSSLVSIETSTRVDMTYKVSSSIGTLEIMGLTAGTIEIGFWFKLDLYPDTP